MDSYSSKARKRSFEEYMIGPSKNVSNTPKMKFSEDSCIFCHNPSRISICHHCSAKLQNIKLT